MCERPGENHMKLAIVAALSGLFCAALVVATLEDAEACGCVSSPLPPPDPPPEFDGVSVNQSSEQIIFEVEEGFVTAHVLIHYVGKPESFAWLVPVPAVPELSLSPESAFALLDRETAPRLNLTPKNECPVSGWTCLYEEPERCQSNSPSGCGCADSDNSGVSLTPDGGSSSGQDAGASSPPVDVVQREVIGAYETVVFSTGDAAAASQWLQDEGFIVNETMAPFMQPYADAGMLFLASKLVPGANTTAIKPLRMRFAAEDPMIPLQLTAVAAEPDMTITVYIYGDTLYQPADFPLVQIDEEGLSADLDGRINYPMLLSRTIDEAGGNGFVMEYAGLPAQVGQGNPCCDGDFDLCGYGGDGICSCPARPFEAQDCASQPELTEGAALVQTLANKHLRLTRLTTRMSAQDMTYDPVFESASNVAVSQRLTLTNELHSLSSCEADIIDTAHYEEIQAMRACTSVYCGARGTCVITDSGAACECGSDTTARRFIDLDGKPSVTCAKDEAPVDLALILPDVCGAVDCGQGSCVDVGGFPTCRCDFGYAAAQTGLEIAPRCEAIHSRSNSGGADSFSEELATLPVCAPAPDSCDEYGYLIPSSGGKRGLVCPQSVPPDWRLERVSAPTCEERGLEPRSSGCAAKSSRSLSGLGFFALLLLFSLRRRRR